MASTEDPRPTVEVIRAADYVPSFKQGSTFDAGEDGDFYTLLCLIVGVQENQIPQDEFHSHLMVELPRFYALLHKKKKIWIGLETTLFHILKRMWRIKNTDEAFHKLELEPPESKSAHIDVGYYEFLKEKDPAFYKSILLKLPKTRHPEASCKLTKPVRYLRAGTIDDGPGQTVDSCGPGLKHFVARKKMEELAISWGFQLEDVQDPKGFAFEVRVPLSISEVEQKLLFRSREKIAEANSLVDPRIRFLIDDHDGATYLFLGKRDSAVVLEEVGSYLSSWEDLRDYCKQLGNGEDVELANFLSDRMRVSRMPYVDRYTKARLARPEQMAQGRAAVAAAKAVHLGKIRDQCIGGLEAYHAVQDRWQFLTELFIYGDRRLREKRDEQVVSWDEIRYEIADAWCTFDQGDKKFENGEQAQEWSDFIYGLFEGKIMDTGDQGVVTYMEGKLVGSHLLLTMSPTVEYSKSRGGIHTSMHA